MVNKKTPYPNIWIREKINIKEMLKNNKCPN